jgi:hypothetical protein
MNSRRPIDRDPCGYFIAPDLSEPESPVLPARKIRAFHAADQMVIVRYPTGKLFKAMRRGMKNPDTAPSTGLSMPSREAPLTGPAGGANIPLMEGAQ